MTSQVWDRYQPSVSLSVMSGLCSKWVRLASYGTNLEFLEIIFLFILAHRSTWDKSGNCKYQMRLGESKGPENWSEEVPDFSHLVPIWPNLRTYLISLVVATGGWDELRVMFRSGMSSQNVLKSDLIKVRI